MAPPVVARLLAMLGCSVGFAVAVVTITLTVWLGTVIIRYLFFSEGPTLGEVGIFPVLLPMRLIVAAWVMWSVFKEGANRLQLNLLVSGAVSFFVLFGWYFMLLGPAGELLSYDNSLYLLAVCDLLYLAAGLAVCCARLLSGTGDRLGNVQR